MNEIERTPGDQIQTDEHVPNAQASVPPTRRRKIWALN
jgi:hypothetical protein